MTDSDKIKTKVGEAMSHERQLNDTACRAHRARTGSLEWLFKLFGGVAVLALGSGVGAFMSLNASDSAQNEKIAALSERVSDFKQLALAMQKSTVEIARSVGRIEGMLAVQPKD